MLTGAALALLPLLAMSGPASVDDYAFPVDVHAQPLSAALQDLARETGIELLFDHDLVRGLRCPRLRERLSVEAALRRLLNGSNLVARRSATGAWLIERAGTPAALPLDLPLPDILVVGTRTQNADIRRRENDVQPYQVVMGDDIVRAHRDDLGSYFMSRVTSNTATRPPSMLGGGMTNSAIDLRGLGTGGTLVLVDGRRLPDIPREWDTTASMNVFSQPDINGIPLQAIDRVETLTGTAGGIYGSGALGGVVNIILKRDYRGVELNATTGITTRGDARRLSIDGRIGFTPDGGRTDITVFVSRSGAQPLLVSERDDTARNRAIGSLLSPDVLWSSQNLGQLSANSVGVFNLFSGEPLSFKPEFGGAALNSDRSYLPAGFNGTVSDLIDSLKRHDGLLDTSLSDGEASSQLGSTATMTSAIFNVRHRFGTGIEGYFDGLILRNHGKQVTHTSVGTLFLYPDSPRNPFEQYISLTFPVPGDTWVSELRLDTTRYTVGGIVNLPHHWKGTIEAIFGSQRYQSKDAERNRYTNPFDDEIGGDDGPDFNPLGNWADFQKSVAEYSVDTAGSLTSVNSYREQSLRLGGPLLTTAAGETTLNLLAERRTQTVRGYRATSTTSAFPGEVFDSAVPGYKSATASLYAELHAPIFGKTAPLPFLRKFEIQLAARYDHQRYDFSTTAGPEDGGQANARFQGIAYTAGAKFYLASWLMLRASYATGTQAPSFFELIPEELATLPFAADPKRGDNYVAFEGDGLDKFGGSPALKAVRAETLSIGAVFNPLGIQGPRVSLDYSRIRRTRDVVYPTEQEILDNEDRWPDRVTRGPLTDGDRALGYTAGPVTIIDATAMNAGHFRVDTIDGQLDWTLPLLAGKLRVYGAATVQLQAKQFGLFGAATPHVGYAKGPLRWRANGGAQWTTGATSVGANLQYYSRYRVYPYDMTIIGDIYASLQGSNWVKAQAFLDLDISRRFRIPGATRDRVVSVDLGIIDILDKAPAREARFSLQGAESSLYADQRRRRVELTVSADF